MAGVCAADLLLACSLLYATRAPTHPYFLCQSHTCSCTGVKQHTTAPPVPASASLRPIAGGHGYTVGPRKAELSKQVGPLQHSVVIVLLGY